MSTDEDEIVKAIALLGRRLRQWRKFASLASITGRWETADRTMVEITCDDEDTIWIVDPPGEAPLDVTPIVDGLVR